VTANPRGIPQHIAIIMDGNGRWAKRRGLPRLAGHRAGAKSVDEITAAAAKMGVKILTLFAFSTENWNRPRGEIEGLFKLLEQHLRKEESRLNKNNIRFSVIGDIAALPVSVRSAIDNVLKSTAGNTGMVLNIAINYGSRAEILEAARKAAKAVSSGEISAGDIDEKIFSGYLHTKDLPDPDLLIRTSGEERLSNFLLWQLSYAELYFTEKLWPDFKADDLREAVGEYSRRERRFGG
jgi:undecaprenyl diphosphate synthase